MGLEDLEEREIQDKKKGCKDSERVWRIQGSEERNENKGLKWRMKSRLKDEVILAEGEKRLVVSTSLSGKK